LHFLVARHLPTRWCFTNGDSQTANISDGAQAVRGTEKDRFRMNFLSKLTEDNGQRTAENTYGQLKHDYFMSSKWYFYLNVNMLTDQFVIYPNLDDTGEYTLRNEAALVTDIGSNRALSLNNSVHVIQTPVR